MYGFETQFMDAIVRFLFGLMALILLEAAAGVFLGLCVYNDARYRGDSNPALWGVLSGFFNIVALVYILVQLTSKNKVAFCVRCRTPIPQGYTAWSGLRNADGFAGPAGVTRANVSAFSAAAGSCF